MFVKKVVVGKLQTNCYLVINNNNCIIIDPGDESSKIIECVGNLHVIGLFVTHFHFDHIGALEQIEKHYKVLANNYSDVLNVEIIKTKGHTKDSLTFYFPKENIMFCGDFLFNGSIGRTDLGGNNNDMIDSLNKISKYNDDIIIYPGHGNLTTLGKEKKYFDYYKKLLK